MGWLRQLGTLFWKNYVIRKRHPFLLVLEVIWPLVIFAAVIIVRLGIPGDEIDSCSYPERAMPSAGLVPFLQSSACTLDNACSTPDKLAERAAAQQRLQNLIYDLEPMLQKQTTLDALEALPTITVVLDALRNSTNATDIKDLDDKLRLRNMFTSPEEVIDILVNKYNILTADAAESLMDSTLNVVTLLEAVGDIDFEEIVCNPTKLTDYVVFAKNVDVTTVSAELCGLDKDLIPNITNTLLRNLDVGNIVRIAEDFSRYTGELDLAVLLGDIAGLVDMYRESSPLLALIGDMSGLDFLPDTLGKLATMIRSMQKLMEIDLKRLGMMYEVVEPMIKSFTDDTELLDSIKDFFDSADDLSSNNNGNTDWVSLMKSVGPVMDAVKNMSGDNSSIFRILKQVMDVPLGDLYNIPALIMGNKSDMGDLESMSINRTLESLQVMFDSLIGNETMGKLPLLGKYSLMMATDISKFYIDMGETLSYRIKENKATADVADMFVQLGPTDTLKLLREMVKLKTTEKLISGELDVKTACLDTTESVFADMKPEDVIYITDTLCSDDVTYMVEDAMSKQNYETLTSMFQSTMDTMDDVMEGKHATDVDFQLKDLYFFAMDEMGSMKDMMATSKSRWNEVLYVASSSVNWEFYNGEWDQVWRTVNAQYASSNMVLMYREVMRTMEGSVMWDTLGSYIQIQDAVMAAIVEPLRTLKGLSDKTTTQGQIVMYAEYLPDIMKALMNDTESEEHQKAMDKLSSGDADLTGVICDDHLLLNLSLAAEVPVTDIEDFLCSTDWSTWMADIMDLYRPASMMQEIEEHVNDTTTNGIDWTLLGMNMEDTFNMLMEYDSFVPEELWDIVAKINMTSPLSSLGAWFGSMPEVTPENLSSYKNIVAPILDSVDKALQNVTYWRLVKHELLTWQASVRVINDYLVSSESPAFNLTEYVTDMSPILGEYLSNSTLYVPDLMATLTSNLKNPAKMVEQLFTMDWSSLCDGSSFSKLMGVKASANLTKFEEGLCDLNWTQIVDELTDNNADIKTYVDEMEIISAGIDNLPDVAVNWTELVRTFEDYMDIVTNYTGSMLDWGSTGLNMDNVTMSWSELRKLFNTTNGLDLKKFAEIADEVMNYLTGMDAGNDTTPALQEITDALSRQMYLQYQFLMFFTKQLEYVNSTNPFNIKKYLNSTEANKLIRLTEKSSDVNAALLHNLLQLIKESDKMNTLVSSNMTNLCNDMTDFASVFSIPGDANLTMSELMDSACGLNINTTLLLEELADSIDGLDDLLDALSLIGNNTEFNATKHSVNYTKYFDMQERFSELLEDVITHPPSITAFWSDPSTTMEKLLSQFENFAKDADMFGVLSNDSVAEMSQVLYDQAMGALLGIQSSSPDINILLHAARLHVDFLDKNHALLDDPDAILANYPELRKLWDVMSYLPELSRTFLYTSATDSEKIGTFISAISTDWDKLCSSDPATLMTVPSDLTFNFTSFMAELCNINTTLLPDEYNQYSALQDLLDLYPNLMNMTDDVNITELSDSIEKLAKALMDSVNSSNGDSNWPRFLNVSVWTEMLKDLDVMFNDTLQNQDSSKMIRETSADLQSMFSQLPELNSFLHVTTLYAKVLDNALRQSRDVVLMSDTAWSDYPEMKKLWDLMSYLPEVYQTYQYTSVTSPNKIANFTALLAEGMDRLCDTDADLLMTVPEDLDFNFTSFLDDLCQVNFTKVDTEARLFSGSQAITDLYAKLPNITESANITDLVDRIESLAGTVTDLFNMSIGADDIPRFLNTTLWADAFEFVTGLFTNTSTLMEHGNNTDVMLSMLASISPEFQEQLRVVEVTAILVDTLLDMIDGAEGASYKLEDFFKNQQEWAKLIKLLQKDGVLEMLFLTLNTPAGTSLVMKPNVTDVLCGPGEDLAQYLTLPNEMPFNLTQFQHELCVINITELVPEFKELIRLDEIQDRLSSNKSIDWLYVVTQNERLLARLEKWTGSPPNITLPTHWTNETYWIDVFTSYSESMSNNSNIRESIDQSIEQMKPLFNLSGFREFGLFLESFLNVIENNLVIFYKENITIKSMIEDIPALNDLFTSLNLTTDVRDDLLGARIKEPTEFINVFTSPDFVTKLCTDSDFWFRTLNITSNTTIKKIQDAFCKLENSSLFDDLMSKIGFTKFIDGLNNTNILPDLAGIINSSSEIMSHIERLMNSSFSFDPMEALDSLKFSNKSTKDLWDLIGILPTLTDILNTSINSTQATDFIHSTVAAGKAISEFLNKVVSEITSSSWDRDIASLFTNSTEARSLLDGLAGMDSTLITGLMSARIKTGKEKEFTEAMLNSSRMFDVFCNSTRLRELLTFPDSVNETSLMNAICNVDGEAMLDQLIDLFDARSIVDILTSGTSNTDIDIKDLVESVKEIIDHLMNITSLENVTFSSLDRLMEVNITELSEALTKHLEDIQADYPQLSTNIFDSLFDSLPGNDSSVVDLLAFLKTWSVWADLMATRLEILSGDGVDLSTILEERELRNLLDSMVGNSSLTDLLQAGIRNMSLLQDIIESENVTERLCGGELSDVLDLPVNSSLTEALCGGNTTALLAEAILSARLFNERYQQQLEIIKDELEMGTYHLNTSSISDSTQLLIDALIEFLKDNRQPLPNAGTFNSLMEKLKSLLEAQYAALIQDWVPVAMDKFEPGTDDEVSKIIATADLVMGFIIDRFNSTKDNMTKEMIEMNSTQLVSLLETLGRLGSDIASFNDTVDVQKLLDIVDTPMVFHDLCANDEMGDWLAVPGSSGTHADDLAEILCLDPDLSLEALENEAAYQDFQDRLTDIWNGTSSSKPDWTSLGNKAEELVSFMTDYFSTSMPTMDLSNWGDFNETMKLLSNTFMDPEMIMKLSRLLFPYMGEEEGEGENILFNVNGLVQRIYYFFKGIDADKLTLDSLLNDPDTMKRVLETMATVDYQLGVYSGGRVQEDIEAGGESQLVRDLVCNVTALESLALAFVEDKGSNLTLPVSRLNALCSLNASVWYSQLLAMNYTVEDFLIIQDMFHQTDADLKHSLTWDSVFDTVRELMDMYSDTPLKDISNITWPVDPWDPETYSGMTNNSMDSLFQLFDMLNGSLAKIAELRELLAFVLTVEDYFDRQVETIADSGWKIPLSTLLPDPDKVADILNTTMESQSAALFMTALIRPDQYIRLLMSQDWAVTVCNYTAFTDTFSFPDGVDVLALQQDICDMHTSQEQAFDDMLSTFNVTDTFNEINAWIANQTNERNVWEEVWRQTELLLENIGRLQNSSDPGMDSWLTVLGEALAAYSGSQEDNWESMCTDTVRYIDGTAFYQNTLQPTLDFISIMTEMTHIHLYLNLELHSAVCDVPTNNLTDLVDELKARSIPDLLQWIAEKYTGNVDDIRFDCYEMPKSYNGLMKVLNETILKFTEEKDATLECMKDSYMETQGVVADIETLFSTGSEILDVLQDDQFREIVTTVLGNDDLLNMTATIIDAFLKQETALSELESILEKNITDVEQLLQEAYNIAPDALNRFLNGTLDIDPNNITAEALIGRICDQTTTGLQLDFNMTLCGADREMAESVADNLIGLARMANKLQSLNTTADAGEWWEILAVDLSDLVGNIEGISELAGLISDLQDIDVTDIHANMNLLDTVQRLLIDSGPDSLINSFNAVLDNFEAIDRTEQTEQIIDSIKLITESLLSFNTLRQLIISNVRISDLVEDAGAFNDYLLDTLQLPDDVAEAIVDGSLSFEILLNVAQADVTQWVCNATQLSEIITMNNASVNASHISESFCGLDQETITAMLEEVLARIDIGDLVKELVTNTMDNIIKDADIDMEDIKDSIKKIEYAQTDLKNIANLLDDYPDNLTEAFASIAESQTGSSGLSSLSAIMCGDEIPEITDEFNVKEALSISDLTSARVLEREELPEGLCRDMYMEIMADREGPIVWSFLKPLLRGRILFSPDTPATRQIINEINSTFVAIENVLKVAESWASGSRGLESLVGEELKEIQEILKSSVISGIMSHVSGVSVSEFDNMLYTMNDTDPEMVTGMANAARLLADYTACLQLDRFQAYDTEAELSKEAFRLGYTNNLLAGIVFMNIDDDSIQKRSVGNVTLPKHVKYKIRVELENVRNTNLLKRRFWRPIPDDNFAGDMRYLRGFLQLQDMLEMAIIRVQTGADLSNISIATQQFPSPCHRDDLLLSVLTAYILPILITVAWVAGLSIAVNNLVYDRENGQEEILKAMGLIGWLNWWAWFLSTLLLMAFVAIFAILMFSYGGIFPSSNILIMFLYLLAFCFSSILLCYCVSAFFTRTSLAILVSLIVYFISYLPYVIILTLEVDMVFWHKILACLSSTTAFSFGAQYIARFEEQQIGAHWDNVQDSPMINDDMNLFWCFMMMLIDGGIYLVLGWYIRNVKPGKFGVSEPWYFPVCPNYWCSSPGSSSSGSRYQHAPDGEYIEEGRTNQPVVMSVRGLGKTFSSCNHHSTVVTDLDLDIHGGEVTTLLGHNGAAKTTTMSMLAGIMEPTMGEVRVNNRPQRKMKESIGICPQHNALFEYMTVQEHMEFCQSIKSHSCEGSNKEDIRQLLKDVDLYHCRDSRVGDLSGGMQRRLCVAMAFIGGSKVVILDEPTSGVDPSGRRTIWNLIIRRKFRTAILLSTHHLDEADVISDRIAILHKGRLMCLGSQMFLKHQLTSGHVLRVVKDHRSGDPEPSQILSVIQQWVPSARLQQMVNYDLAFTLPAASHHNFYGLFQHLEDNREDLQIDSFGVSDPTLEEAFLKVCHVADSGLELTPATVATATAGDNSPQTDDKNGASSDYKAKDTSVRVDRVSRYPRITGLSWKMAQFGALLTKRFHHYRRNWRMIVSTVILPILLFLVANAVYSVKPSTTDSPNLFLSPAMYGPDSYVHLKDESTDPLSSKIFNTFVSEPGIGTSCMDGMTDLPGNFYCKSPAVDGFYVPDYDYNPNATCTCDDYKYTCDEGSAQEPPRQQITVTTDIVQDLEGRDIDTYLRDTFFDFIEKRYGGWSMEDDTGNGANSSKLKSKVWFNNNGFHALPAFYNAFSNGLLRSFVDPTVHGPAEEYGISAYNHPLLLSEIQLSHESLLQSAADCGIALVILLAFTFIPVGIATYVVHEYITREKHVQFASGVGPVLYWIASLVWDLVILGMCVALSVAVMAIFKNDTFWERNNMAALVVLIALYGWATITFTYCVVKLFKTVAASFFTLFCMFNFLGIVTVTCIFCLDYYRNLEHIGRAYDVLRYAFLVIPPYAFGSGVVELITNQLQADIFLKFDVDLFTNPFSFDLLGWNFIALGAEGLIFFIVAILLDKISWNVKSSLVYDSPLYEDEDVVAEKQRVLHSTSDDILTVNNLSKVYRRGGKPFLAVDHISFGVSKGECFGLLGVNGAGKTTSFKMLTGALAASDGTMYLQGQRVRVGSSKLGRDLGYCPQEEALDSYLSVLEMLYFHAKLRGIPASSRSHAVSRVMEQLNIEPIQNKVVKNCSGGMRRKLSLAIALLGDPAIVLLDEPTTGMDATSKRLAWRSLVAAREQGQAIILTSHSMEECDVLCNRLAIMVNGQFKCFGGPQYLKNRFGDGYTVTLYMCGLSASKNSLMELIQTYFPGSSIRDCHENVLQLDIPRSAAEVSTIFGVLDREKERYNILYYTVSQTTLETIFLNFAREQSDSSSDIGDSSASSDVESGDTILGEPLTNGRYAYMNTAYDYKGDQSKLADRSQLRMQHPTLVTENSYVTKL